MAVRLFLCKSSIAFIDLCDLVRLLFYVLFECLDFSALPFDLSDDAALAVERINLSTDRPTKFCLAIVQLIDVVLDPCGFRQFGHTDFGFTEAFLDSVHECHRAPPDFDCVHFCRAKFGRMRSSYFMRNYFFATAPS